MCNTLGIQHISTTAYHPQSNGLVERFHRQLKESLRSRDAGSTWWEHVPWVLLGIRTAPKEDSAISAGEAVYGSALVLPGQLKDPLGRAAPTWQRPPIPLRQRSYAEVARSGSGLLDGVDWVYVRRGPAGGPTAQSYVGPYRVLGRSDKVFTLQVGDRVERTSADRLKPHTGAVPTPGEPPRRGRPPGSGGKGQPSSECLEGGPVDE